jgi:hypothetical protein
MGRLSENKTDSKALKDTVSIEAAKAEVIEIGQIFQRAVYKALEVHKRLGNPIAAWKNGRVIIIPPEEIIIPADESEDER